MIFPYQTTQSDIPQNNGYEDSISVLMMEAAASHLNVKFIFHLLKRPSAS
jgi:hypothetical protein